MKSFMASLRELQQLRGRVESGEGGDGLGDDGRTEGQTEGSVSELPSPPANFPPAKPGPLIPVHVQDLELPGLAKGELTPTGENLMALTPEALLALKKQLYTEAFNGDSSQSRIKAALVLLEYNAMTKAQAVREQRGANSANAIITNVVNVVTEAQKASRTYESPAN